MKRILFCFFIFAIIVFGAVSFYKFNYMKKPLFSMYEVLQERAGLGEGKRRVILKGYFTKMDLPRLFVNEQDALIKNLGASVAVVSNLQLNKCDDSYVYLTGFIWWNQKLAVYEIVDIDLFMNIENSFSPEGFAVAEKNNGVNCEMTQ